MGCDIHIAVQKYSKINKRWLTLDEKLDEPRNYFLFHCLAGVRSESSWNNIPPVSQARGFPSDVGVSCDECIYLPSGRKKWLGDHSHSWLTISELLAYFETVPSFCYELGFITLDQYLLYRDKGITPTNWCKGISGPRIIKFTEAEYENSIKNNTLPTNKDSYIPAMWKRPIDSTIGAFKEECIRLKNAYPDSPLRLIFGFDS